MDILKKDKKQSHIKNIIIPGKINLLIILYYLPFLIGGIENIEIIYNIIDPYTIAPIIVGLFSLYNLIKNQNIIISLISFCIFVFSVLISLVGIMSIYNFIEFLIYLPSAIILLIHFIIVMDKILKFEVN